MYYVGLIYTTHMSGNLGMGIGQARPGFDRPEPGL